MPKPIRHEDVSDEEFIAAMIQQSDEMKAGFREHGFDPDDLPEHFVIQVYPSTLIRLVDILKRRGQ